MEAIMKKKASVDCQNGKVVKSAHPSQVQEQ
jgi:hypothetical protein